MFTEGLYCILYEVMLFYLIESSTVLIFYFYAFFY